MGSLVVETQGLTKRFGRTVAVRDLDLRIPGGTLFGLIGPNGAGKTTTLRMLAGLIEPSAGVIHFNGRQMTRGGFASVHHRVGYMPDFFGVYEDMRTWEYLDFFARCYEIPPGRRARVIDELLALVDLTEKRDTDVHALSRGMKQRLCLAHALVHDPDILLLDEPASGLDPRARLEIRELLRELRSMGKTVVISSHILSELEEMCDMVGIMERGRLVADGSVADIERTLAPHQIVRVKVTSPAAEAVAILEALPSVDSVEALPEGSNGGGEGWIGFELEGDEAARVEVLRQLVASGVAVSAFTTRERDLEDLFMQLTKGEVS